VNFTVRTGIAEDLLRLRKEPGVTYFVMLEYAIERFAAVLNRLPNC
jgi:hypothetical protein